MLYYAQIYSHLSYGLKLWGNIISNTQLITMQKLQNQAIKLVDPNQTNVETSYRTLEILKLKEAIKMIPELVIYLLCRILLCSREKINYYYYY